MTKTILVVEDEQALATVIGHKLSSAGFDAVSASSVEQALGYITNLDVSAIWLDHYLLGKENGLDLVTKIKDNKHWKDIPIFVVSNTATADKVKSYLAIGVNEFYIKSNYRLDQIVGDITNHLTTSEK